MSKIALERFSAVFFKKKKKTIDKHIFGWYNYRILIVFG